MILSCILYDANSESASEQIYWKNNGLPTGRGKDCQLTNESGREKYIKK